MWWTCEIERMTDANVANLNSMLAPFGLQRGQCSEKTPAVDGKYLCHHKQSKHFTGLYASEDFSGLCQRGGKALECRSSGWSCRVRWCHILLAPVRNPQKHCHDKELGCFHWRRPTKTWRISSLFVCSGCHGTLLKRCEVASTLYDLAGRQEVIAVTKQCSVRSCRASYGYNVQLCLAKWFQDECCEPGRLSRWSSICE